MSSQRRITFRKEKKGIWDNSPDSWEIRYQDETMGRITEVENGFRVVLRTPKTVGEMVIEPNCCWKWMRLNEIFPSFVSAKSALNASKEELKGHFDKLFEIEEMHRGTRK